MDNLPRYPDGWTVNGQVITIRNLNPNIFVYEGLSPAWNRQGRIVDFSAQMVLFARNLATIAEHVGQPIGMDLQGGCSGGQNQSTLLARR